MKKMIMFLMAVMLFVAEAAFAADSALAVANTVVDAKAVATKTTLDADAVKAVTATAVPAVTPYIEGVMPPSIEEGAYEDPGEPAPTADEADAALEKQSEARKKKHFTIEQTLYTPSSIGTKIGYFINENWRVMAEFSTISQLIANSNHEKNISWAVSGNYSPADDDWSPFYGAGFTMMDLNYNEIEEGDSINVTKQFTGGYINAGVTWITDSILMASIEFDLYAGRTRMKEDNITTPLDSKDETYATLSVMIGATIGLCF